MPVRVIIALDVPVIVSAPLTVCVVPAVKLIVFPAAVHVKPENVVDPLIVAVVVPAKVTVFEPGVKVPELDQLPATEIP